MTNQCKSAIYYYKNQKILLDNFNDNLINMTINNKKIITPLEINFNNKNKQYKSISYIIMIEEMENNIHEINNIQYFLDVTYLLYNTSNQK